MNIVVVGSSNTDMIIKAPRIPKPGETILGGEFKTAAGGKGANQAVAAARAGGDVAFVARVGNDMLGEQAVAGWKKDGINVEHVKIDDIEPSGVAFILVDNDGENSIAVASGANAHLSNIDVQSAKALIEEADILLMQLETPLDVVAEAAKMAKVKNKIIILNPAPAQRLSTDFVKVISILTPNESEAELLTGITVVNERSAQRAAEKLKDFGVETVILTLGARGVFVLSDEFSGMFPAFQMNAVDTTGAGDVFNGALAAAMASKFNLKDAIQFAQAAAALSVTTVGAQPGAPIKKDIVNFLAHHS